MSSRTHADWSVIAGAVRLWRQPGRVSWLHSRAIWLPIVLLLGQGTLAAYLIASGASYLGFAVALALPASVLLIRHPFIAVILWLLLVPYLLATPMEEQRVIYWILHRGMIPAALVLSILSRWFGTERRAPVRAGPPELAMLAFLLLTTLSILLFNEDPVRSGRQFYDRLFVPFCAYWLIRLTAPNERELKWLLWVAAVNLAAQCAIALLAWFIPQLLPAGWVLRTVRYQRTFGSLRNPAAYTGTLLLFGLLLYQYGMSRPSLRVRHLAMIPLAVAVFFVFFTFSRSSWVGGVLVLAGAVWVYPRMTARLAILLVVVLAVAGSTVLVDELDWARERVTGDLGRSSAEGRLVIGNALLGMAKAKPVFGWGYNNYQIEKLQFFEPVWDIRVGARTRLSSHNSYLTIAAELGLVGLVLYLLPVGWWLVLSIKARRRMASEGFVSRKLLALLWLLMLHLFVESNLVDMISNSSFGTTLWWLGTGVIASIVHPYIRANDVPQPVDPDRTSS